MIVLIIASVLMAFAVPELGKVFKRTEMKSAVRDLVTTMRLARELAVFTGDLVELRIEMEKSLYYLKIYSEEKKKYQRKEAEEDFEQTRYLPKKVVFAQIDAEEGDESTNIVSIFFYSDGTASSTKIVIEDEFKKQATVEVFRNTGMAVVEMPEKPKKQQAPAAAEVQAATPPVTEEPTAE